MSSIWLLGFQVPLGESNVWVNISMHLGKYNRHEGRIISAWNSLERPIKALPFFFQIYIEFIRLLLGPAHRSPVSGLSEIVDFYRIQDF